MKTVIPKQVPYACLFWQLPDGSFLGNQDGEYLSVEVNVFDLKEVKKRSKLMEQAAAHYGYPEGRTVCITGRKKVTQSEWEDQMAAMEAGEDIPGDYISPQERLDG